MEIQLILPLAGAAVAAVLTVGLILLIKAGNLFARCFGLVLCLAAAWVTIEFYAGGDRAIGAISILLFGGLMLALSFVQPGKWQRRRHAAVSFTTLVVGALLLIGYSNDPVNQAAEHVQQSLAHIRAQIHAVTS